MEDWIINRINEIIQGVGELGTEGDLIKSPQEYNGTLYNGVLMIMENAVMPVAYVLLGLLFMLELYNITIRTEGMSNNAFEIPFRAMFKIAICKLVVDSTPLIMGAIYGISTFIISNIGAVFGSETASVILDQVALRQQIADMRYTTKLLTAVQVLLIWLIYKFASLIILVIIIGRMVEIYVYIAVAPIPIATFPNTELSSVAKNFLKSFAAVSIQGVLIMIVLAMYGTLVASVGGATTYDDFSDALWQAMLYSVVLVVALFMTRRWSNSITNAM